MLPKIFVLCALGLALACSATTAEEVVSQQQSENVQAEAESQQTFETAHKLPDSLSENAFHTSHKIQRVARQLADLDAMHQSMSLLPTKERPELNPVLSALINDDVRRSIEAKRAIEQEELDSFKTETHSHAHRKHDHTNFVLTTTKAPTKKHQKQNINEDFVDQSVNLDVAGSESNKKSRIEIKKGPNGQDYEYEYVYYYEDEDDGMKQAAEASVQEPVAKSRYSNVESSTAPPKGNEIVRESSKGRSAQPKDAEKEVERLPVNTRFPSRGKGIEVQPTPSLDSFETAAEKKKIQVKRPSLELVDSDTFNTDEKQVKGFRNSDSEYKIQNDAQEELEKKAAAVAAEKAEKDESALEQTTPIMEKAALDLYAILSNENFNMDMTTTRDDLDTATSQPGGTTTSDEGDNLTTVLDEERISSTTPSTTTTTTTPSTTTSTTTTTTTTTSTTPAPVTGRRPGSHFSSGRNRFKLKQNSDQFTSTTEAPASEAPKSANRFVRPSFSGRGRLPTRKTTVAPETAEPVAEEKEVVAAKEVKPLKSSGFGRGRPRNRFSVHSTTTTERSVEEGGAADDGEKAAVSSTTSRPLTRGRPTNNLRLRGRVSTPAPSRAPAASDGEEAANSGESSSTTAAPHHTVPKISRFNINRAGANRFAGRGRLPQPAAEQPAATPAAEATPSESSNDVDSAEQAAPAKAAEPVKTNVIRPRTRAGIVANNPVNQRRVNPLIARRPFHIGASSTTEAPAAPAEEPTNASGESKEETKAAAEETAEEHEDTTDEVETTTKAQLRGLLLLGQRRRLRKPGTIL